MSRNRITEMGSAKVRGGIELTSYKRSARGTRYRSQSIVVITKGLAKKDVRDQVKLVVEQLMENPE